MTVPRSPHQRTPEAVLARVRRLGDIGLDPCSVRGSLVEALVEWHGPAHELEDGLARSWAGYGLVYCFPPPADAARWARKIAEEAAAGVEIVALLASRTGAAWLYDYVLSTAAAVCYWRGSLRAIGEPRKSVTPRLVAYWGERAEAFGKAFATAGAVVLGHDVDRPREWRLVVPMPSPTGTWVAQQGRNSKAVRAYMQRFAGELDKAVAAARCTPATGPRHLAITRYGAGRVAPASLRAGGQLVEALLVERGLLAPNRDTAATVYKQAIDRRQPRTEIIISRANRQNYSSPP